MFVMATNKKSTKKTTPKKAASKKAAPKKAVSKKIAPRPEDEARNVASAVGATSLETTKVNVVLYANDVKSQALRKRLLNWFRK